MANENKTPITDKDIENIQGGAAAWQQFAKGTYVKSGNCILYKIAAGDALSGIALRFGVSIEDIKLWNPSKIKDVNLIYAGQQITIYPTILR